NAVDRDDDVRRRRQELVFGSADLRRVVLHRVIRDATTTKTTTSKAKTTQSKHKNKNKNKTLWEEEREALEELNEELGRLDRGATVLGGRALSPRGDGSLVAGGEWGEEGGEPAIDSSADVTTYILRGGGMDLPAIAAAVRHRQRSPAATDAPTSTSSSRLFRFVFVPRVTEMERAFLKRLGVVIVDADDATGFEGGTRRCTVESLPIDLIPLDDDVWSLELGGGAPHPEGDCHDDPSRIRWTAPRAAAMRRADVEGCESDVVDLVARSLIKLQVLNRRGLFGNSKGGRGTIYDERHFDDNHNDNDNHNDHDKDTTVIMDQSALQGAIARIQGLGPLAAAVVDRMMTLRLEEVRMELQEQDDEAAEHDEQHEEYFDDNDDDGGGGDDYQYDDGNEQKEDDRDRDRDRDQVSAASGSIEVTASHSAEFPTRDNHDSTEPTENDIDIDMDIPAIQALLVIDRKIDLVTPMLTPLTYEGLIDDVLGIHVGGCAIVPKSLVEPPDDRDSPTGASSSRSPRPDDPPVLLHLDDADPLYPSVRDQHVETFGSFLQNRAKTLQRSHSEFTNRDAATARDLTELHRFVKQIPEFARNLRSLTNHIHVAEEVKTAAERPSFRRRWQIERSMLESEPCYDALEDGVAEGEPLDRWLRLLCLQSLTGNGIKATRYDSLRKEAVQTYGYECLWILRDLEKAGFLRKRETFFMDSMATSYSNLRKALNLIVPEVDPARPEDVAYVSSGYAPMSVRWVQGAMTGFAGLEEAVKELPVAVGGGSSGSASGSGVGAGGRYIDVEQRWPPETLAEALRRPRGVTLEDWAKRFRDWVVDNHVISEDKRDEAEGQDTDTEAEENTKPVLLVYFIGGVTHMEIAGLRFLSKSALFPYSILCCTTEIVNGSTLLRSLSC
ncbi:hypothetical protein ACHAXS_003520, partial [Conticribra weissflogii]